MPALALLAAVMLTSVGVVAFFRVSFASPNGDTGPTNLLTVSKQAENTPVIPGMPSCAGPEGNMAAGNATAETPTPSAVSPEQAPTTTVSPPTSTPTSSPSVFGLAWFHKPPGDGTTPEEMAKAHSYIHLTSAADIAYRNQLRAAGYKGPIYTYMTATAVEGPGPYKTAKAPCAAGYAPNDNNLAWKVDDFCRFIHPNESWFLHNGKGERLVDDYFGSGRWTYLMNPANPGWQAFAQERLLFVRDNWGYDGVWLDNVDIDLSRARSESKNSDGVVQEFSNNDSWRAAWKVWLGGVRGKVGEWAIWANLVGGGLSSDSWDAFAPYLDGAMDESFSVRWLDGWREAGDWKSQLERADRWLASGKGLVMVGQGSKDDTGQMRFTLASYMLVAQGQEAFYRYTRFDSYYGSLWQYPEFSTARALGQPTGSRQETSPGVWTRQFSNGTVEVDLNSHVGKLIPKQKP